MTTTKQPYRMGLWESFMYRCGYVRRDRACGVEHDGKEVAKFNKPISSFCAGLEVTKRHFPNKSLLDVQGTQSGKVYLQFTDGTKAEIVGEEAKAILEAE